jgi:hypothetical protein
VRAVKKPNKSEFIRAQPAELSASEVVKKASDAGLKLSPQLVYVIRSAARRKRTGQVMASGRPTRARRGTAGHSDSSISMEFLALVTEIGLSNAEALLKRFKAEVASIDLG